MSKIASLNVVLLVMLGLAPNLASAEIVPDLSLKTLKGDHIQFDYANFRNVTVTSAEAGLEPLYQFDANVFRAFFSLYF